LGITYKNEIKIWKEKESGQNILPRVIMEKPVRYDLENNY